MSDLIIRQHSRVLPFSVSAHNAINTKSASVKSGEGCRVTRFTLVCEIRADYAMMVFRAGGNDVTARGKRTSRVTGALSAPSDRDRGSVSSLNASIERGERGEAEGRRRGREMMSSLTHVHRIRPRAILLSAQTALS